jgi:hypothetical protein
LALTVVELAPAPLIVRWCATVRAPRLSEYGLEAAGTTTVSPDDEYLIASRSEHVGGVAPHVAASEPPSLSPALVTV